MTASIPSGTPIQTDDEIIGERVHQAMWRRKIEGVRGAPHYNALDFDARTTDGRVLERTYDGGATTLEYGEVLEGEFVVGDVAYPAVGDIASITYTPNFKRKATWQVRP